MPVRNALVPIVPNNAAGADLRRETRANADFVAHLIATSAQMPQTRARRRAEPGHAIAAYSALGQRPTPLGRALSRWL
jgi:hypothetical protein